MTSPKTILGIILVAGLGYGAWTFFFPSEEKQIRKALIKLAETASFSAGEKSLSRLGAINAVPRFFHTNAVVRIASGHYSGSLNGRPEIREAVAGSRAVAQSLDIRLTDPQVTLLSRSTARVLVTATVYVDGDPNPQLQILKLAMEKEKNRWLIKRIDPIHLDGV